MTVLPLAEAHFIDLPDPETGTIYEKTRSFTSEQHDIERDELGWISIRNRKTGRVMRVPPQMVRRVVELPPARVNTEAVTTTTMPEPEPTKPETPAAKAVANRPPPAPEVPGWAKGRRR